MAHENDIVIQIGESKFPFMDVNFPRFNATDFSNLNNLLNVVTPSTALASAGAFSEGDFAVFLGTFNVNTNPIPISWDDFANAYRTFTGNGSGPRAGTMWTEFVKNYRQMLGMTDLTITSDVSGGDMALLLNKLDDPAIIDPPTIKSDGEAIQNQFVNSFSHFIARFPYEANGTVGDFFAKWAKFMSKTAVINAASVGTTGVPSYEDIFTAFGFTASALPDKLKAFYDQILKETGGSASPERGFFIASIAIDEWFESVRQEYLDSNVISSVGSEQSRRVLVIDRILRLLIEMIDIMQRISASQAQRLIFLTNWQQAYTNLLVDVPTFTIGDGSAIDETGPEGDKKAEQKARDAVNPKMQALQEKTRARRSQVSDFSKAMQSVINQSQDAANQQTDIATAILQQLSTILASIFR